MIHSLSPSQYSLEFSNLPAAVKEDLMMELKAFIEIVYIFQAKQEINLLLKKATEQNHYKNR